MENTPALVQVITASTRPECAGRPVARWVTESIGQWPGLTVESVDLGEVALPLYNEPHHPRLGTYVHQHTRDFSAVISRADAFVLVFPEYNHSYNAALKNAIDYLFHEWSNKPAGLVSYGGIAGGARAAQALKPVLASVKMVTLPEGVLIPMVGGHIHGEGAGRTFVPTAEIEEGLQQMVEAMTAWIPICRQVSPQS